MKQPDPIAKDLVLVGGGHAHVIVLRMLGMKPIPGLQVTLIAPDSRTAYSGMLPGVVAGHYTPEEIHIELGPLCRFAGARFIRSAATGIDPVARRVHCEGRPDIAYDVLSLDIGITPAVDAVPGAAEHAIAVKPIGSFLEKFDAFLAEVKAGAVRHIGFVGAGAGGIELCLAVHHRLRQEGIDDFEAHVFSDALEILPAFPSRVRDPFIDALEVRGIHVHHGFDVARVTARGVVAKSGESVELDRTFFVTQAASQPWLADTGLDLDEAGFITVRETLQSTRYDDVFAAGDITANVDHPRPRAGVFAVRQGKPLYRNIRRVLLDKAARAFRPQREFLSLISTGDKFAVAVKWGRVLAGAWVWRWKDWIDRRFMERFNRLPEMKTQKQTGLLSVFDDQMQCGGCGSKVAADLLEEVLAELGVTADLDDAAVFDVPEGKVMLHTVDHFRAFLDDPWTFARIAANHALSDIHAMGGTPVTALAMITVPFATPAKTREMLRQLMQGALVQLSAEDVALVGGHTSEGMELSLGFAVNGLVDREVPLRKSGLQPGDVLILTKPLGTGALFAADMQLRAKGEWIERAIESMLASNAGAAQILVSSGATAMTDVTGFGLAGHLSEMLAASNVGAHIELDALPVLPGAIEVLEQGIRSTLHEGNRRAIAVSGSGGAREQLLFDPQTAGGLLAGIPSSNAGDTVARLREAGCSDAAVVGQVIAGEGMAIA